MRVLLFFLFGLVSIGAILPIGEVTQQEIRSILSREYSNYPADSATVLESLRFVRKEDGRSYDVHYTKGDYTRIFSKGNFTKYAHWHTGRPHVLFQCSQLKIDFELGIKAVSGEIIYDSLLTETFLLLSEKGFVGIRW